MAARSTPLCSVDVVCREREQVAALPHVVQRIDDFLDYSDAWEVGDAAKEGYIHLLHRIGVDRDSVKQAKEWQFEVGFKAAVEKGDVDVVKWLFQYYPQGKATMAKDTCARLGHLELLRWLHENNSEPARPYTMDVAAANGQLEVVQYLHAHGPIPCTSAAMDNAAARGHLQVVRWLHEHRSEGCTTAAMDRPTQEDDTTVLEFLRHHRAEGCTFLGMYMSVCMGHFSRVKWFYEHYRDSCDLEKSLQCAKIRGQQEIAAWLQARVAQDKLPGMPPVFQLTQSSNAGNQNGCAKELISCIPTREASTDRVSDLAPTPAG